MHAHIGYNTYPFNTHPAKYGHFSEVVLCNNFAFHKHKWIIKDEDKNWQILSLKGTSGDAFPLGCHIENSSKCVTALCISIEYTRNKPKRDFYHMCVCSYRYECWYSFTIFQSVLMFLV